MEEKTMVGTRSKKKFKDQATMLIKGFRKKGQPTLTDTVRLIRNLCNANDNSRAIYINELLRNESDLKDLELNRKKGEIK
jgi:hypothetical protein